MISMRYRCPECGVRTSDLDTAQHHADQTQHTLEIFGTLSPRPSSVYDKTAIEKAAAERARNSAIMREARDRGLLKTPVGGKR